MALQDKIGRKEIVDKVCWLVDSLKKDGHLCVAINGAWGSGKSFVLNMIEERLSIKAEYVIIKYDSWENSFYSDPLLSILSCIIDGIEERFPLAGSGQKVKNAVKAGLNTAAELSPKVQKWKTIADGLLAIVKSFQHPVDTARLEEFKSYQKLLREVRQLLDKITFAEEKPKDSAKLVILVDEIDRCLPDEQLKILERLHHLFEVKNCAMVVTMNQNCVANTISTMYGTDGYEYLRKLFDFTFWLPVSAKDYLRTLFDDFVKRFVKLGVSENKIEPAVNLAYQCLLYGSKDVLDEADNRELTRYFEGVMNIINDFGIEKMNSYYAFFVLIALYIRRFLSKSFLNPDDVMSNQNEFISSLSQLDLEDRARHMPYYDYLSEFLGVDRGNPPKEIGQNYAFGQSGLSKYSCLFNEIICSSLIEELSNIDSNSYLCKPSVVPDDCKTLCRLVVRYGGEQQNSLDETKKWR